jgi:DNA-binding NtrC family response regulator
VNIVGAEGQFDPRALEGIVGCSPSVEELRSRIAKVSLSDLPALITGETGTGKGLVAHAIHDCGPRRSKPFIPVDCTALPPGLIESELFGHARGAFTGADLPKQGLLEAANGGTVFLDQIGDLPLAGQVKLLRALQEPEVRPLGSLRRVQVGARILAASNHDLPRSVKDRRLLYDLYFRLDVLNIDIAPLRERPQDIPLLAAHFLRGAVPDGPVPQFSEAAMDCLLAYHWPGNVRELENTVRRAVCLASGPVLQATDLLPAVTRCLGALRVEVIVEELRRSLTLRELQRAAVLRAVEGARGDKSLAASILGIGKRTLYRKLKEIRGT